MTITTFYEPIWGTNAREVNLLQLWIQVWQANGWEPVVVGLDLAITHPKYQQMEEKIKALPTVNDRKYERVCFLRWLAFAQVGGLIADYDVFPRVPYPPEAFEDKDVFVNGTQTCACGFISGTKEDLEKIVDTIIEYKPDQLDVCGGRPHVSDMTIIIRKREELFKKLTTISSIFGLPGWETYPLVHFANQGMDAMKAHLIRKVLNL